ncbi:MAG: hypothetical protein EXR70_12550 [Deltaproteobacteria bacterium]|nr:hypothetical protein [Deltaproteobacteria bacterium]
MGAETLVGRLRARLGHHALWDTLLMSMPPILFLFSGAYAMTRAGWISSIVAIEITFLGLAFGAAVIAWHYRRSATTSAGAAQLLDERAGAKDHFLTLATIDRSAQAPSLIAQLTRQSAELGGGIELKRDFPYQPRPAAYRSVAGSVLAALLLFFLMPYADSLLHPPSSAQRLRELAAKMASAPGLKELSQQLKQLAAKLDDPKVAPDEKKQATEDLQKQIAEQQQKEQKKKNQEMLAQAQSELKDSQQQQSAGGQEQQKDQQSGGGNQQSNLPKEGQGEGKQSQGNGGEGKGESSAQASKDMQQGKQASGNPKEAGQEKNQMAQGDTKGNQPDPNQPGKEQNKNQSDKNPGDGKDSGGKNQSAEAPPQGAPPSDRFYKTGEGKDGLKGARYVTVQLPEDVAAESKGESAATKESKGGRARPQVPVSNAPLPAHVPNAPSEKQQMPIEYRGVIR